MSMIKKFFSKKKDEVAFKLNLGGSLGHGYTLSAQNPETSTSCQKHLTDAYNPPERRQLSDEARTAAAAALERSKKKTSKEVNTSLAYIKAQAKKEIESEQNKLHEASSQEAIEDSCPDSNSTCQGVLFRCPLIDEAVLPEDEWRLKIKEFLYQQLETEKALTSILVIRNCNNKEKAEDCIKTLSKYLENIINFPEQETYYKIRMQNRVFCEKVKNVNGALDFLHAAGFREVKVDNEFFFIWTEENVEKGFNLNTLLEALQNSEPFQLILDRNIKVLLPSQATRIDLSPDFYTVTSEEVRREQRLRAEAIEDAQILKTQAMRDREKQQMLRMYKYAIVRVKFPNGIFIQGTFDVNEKLTDVFAFVQSCLEEEALEFTLVTTRGEKFTDADMDRTLYDLRFVPNIVLLFKVHDESLSANKDLNFLKDDILLLIQTF